MKLLIDRELAEQAIRLLDNLENDKKQIPKILWDDRTRLLINAKVLGYKVYNAPDHSDVNFEQNI